MARMTPEKLAYLYEQGGPYYRPGAWKEETDRIITPDVITKIYHILEEQGYIPPYSNDFVFVSPTANVPTHERVLFDLDKEKRKGRSLFFAGDICKFVLAPDQIQIRSSEGNYQYFQWDAQHLPFAPGTVDMIWDRKGCLWHCADSRDSDGFLETMQEYYRVLRPNGTVVADDIGGFEEKYGAHLHRLSGISQLYLLIRILGAKVGLLPRITPSLYVPLAMLSQAERSTGDYFDELYEGNSAVFRDISTMFRHRRFGSNILSILVFEKRANDAG